MDLTGRRFGNYRVLHPLGQGGFGAVYVAEHPMMARKAAVKVLRRSLAEDPEYLSRFFNEARATSAIRHPNIVEVFDVGVTGDGLPYILMELLEGETLRQRIEHTGPLPLRTAVSFARQCAGALWAAHRAGVVHRDFKPDNVFIVADERIRLLDFGIAKLTGVPTSNVVETEAGKFLGSPRYTSPEQWDASPSVDHRTDVYALGAVLFEMLTGGLLFAGENVFQLRDQHLHAEVPRIRQARPEIPPALEDLVQAMLAKDPAGRPADMSEVGAALDAVARLATGAGKVEPSAVAGHTEPTFPPRTLVARAQPEHRFGGRAVVLGAAGLLLLAAGVLFATRTPIRQSTPRVVERREPSPEVPPVVERRSRPVAAAVARAAVVVPATASWRITSRPAGALVVDADSGKVIGRTPWQAKLPADARPRRLRLSLKGYGSQVLEVPARGDFDQVVTLQKLRRRQPRAPGEGDIVL